MDGLIVISSVMLPNYIAVSYIYYRTLRGVPERYYYHTQKSKLAMKRQHCWKE